MKTYLFSNDLNRQSNTEKEKVARRLHCRFSHPAKGLWGC